MGRISEPTELILKFKMTFWRAAGLNYIQYSAIAARVVRKALKEQLQADAAKRDITGIKFVKWEGGKAVGGVKKTWCSSVTLFNDFSCFIQSNIVCERF